MSGADEIIGTTINGANLCHNSDFSAGLTAWEIYKTDSSMSITSGVGLSTAWTLKNDHTAYIAQTGCIGNALAYTEIITHSAYYIPIEAGKAYCLSVYTGAHRAKVKAVINWRTATSYLNSVNTQYNDEEYSGGQYLDEYKRLYVIAVAPANAVFAQILLRKYDTTDPTDVDSYAFFSHVMFSEVNSNQVVPPAYQPYGTYGAVWNLNITGQPTSLDDLDPTAYADLQTALLTGAQAISDAANAQETADGKINSFYQTSAPTSGMSLGDFWIDTDAGNKLYRYSGSAWVAIQDSAIATAINAAQTAQTTADGKAVVFYQASAPTTRAVGDLWYDTDDAQKRLYRWSGSAWSVVASYGASWDVNIINQPAASDIYNSYHAIVTNLLPYCEFADSTKGWSLSYPTAGATDTVFNVDLNSTWTLLEGHTGYMYQPSALGTPNTDYALITSEYIPIIAGKHYCCSAYGGTRACKGAIQIQFFNASYAHLSYGTLDYLQASEGYQGGQTLAGYHRMYAFDTAPTGAVFAKIRLLKYVTDDGSAESYFFFTKCQFSEASANQTLPPAYVTHGITNPAGVINEGITTIDGGKITANSITADRIVANSITAGQLAASCITSSEVGANQIITNTANIANAMISTAKIQDLAVSTLKIANQAVTIPIGVTSTTLTQSTSNVSYTTLLSASITSTGAPIFLTFGFHYVNATAATDAYWVEISTWFGSTKLGATCELIQPESHPHVYEISFLYTPGIGTHTFYLKVKNLTSSKTLNTSYKYITLLEVKK